MQERGQEYPVRGCQPRPVYDAPDLRQPLGNLLEEPIEAIWARYPFKAGHYAKYLGASIRAAARAKQ